VRRARGRACAKEAEAALGFVAAPVRLAAARTAAQRRACVVFLFLSILAVVIASR
jgi:hypothetical protein